MFTGIIQKTARIKSARTRARVLHVQIEKPRAWRLKNGESISVDGICSTVTKSTTHDFGIEYMPETLRKTTAESFGKGLRVNLERSMRRGNRVDGHFVQGHVDATGLVEGFEKEGASRLLTIRVPGTLASSIAVHGSAAINGTSLTVARRHGPHVTFALIPYTLKRTNLSLLKKGDQVNIETDRLGFRAVAARVRGGRVKRHAAKRIRKKK